MTTKERSDSAAAKLPASAGDPPSASALRCMGSHKWGYTSVNIWVITIWECPKIGDPSIVL